MKREPRLKKVRYNMAFALSSSALWIYSGIAVFAQQLVVGSQHSQMFAQMGTGLARLLYSIPGVPFLYDNIPYVDSGWGFSWGMIVVFAAILIPAFFWARHRFHRQRLNDEDKQRDFKDL